jgi:hypothetical protein
LKTLHKIASLTLVVFSFSCGKVKKGDSFDNPGGENVSANETLKEELFPSEYVSWVRDPNNGLVKDKEMDELKFSVLFKPSEYIICQEERSEKISTALCAKKLDEMSELEYYDLKIELKDGQEEILKHDLSSSSQYGKRVEYCSFQMQKDIVMLNGSDSIQCAMLHFERAFDIAPYATFLLAFPKQKGKDENRTIILHDKLFGKGILKFQFKGRELNNLPKLKTV